jgi:hypothetical protein
VFARHSLATKWVQSAGSVLRVAVVARPEFHDPQNIAMLMMQNRGTISDAFTNEIDALKWLDGRQPDQRTPSFLNRGRSED